MTNEHLYREWSMEEWEKGFEETSNLAQTEYELNYVFKKEDNEVKELLKIIENESEEVVLETLKSMIGYEFEVCFGQVNTTIVKLLDVVDLDNIVLRLINDGSFLEFVNLKELNYYVINAVSYGGRHG